jgi:hypothetical protein
VRRVCELEKLLGMECDEPAVDFVRIANKKAMEAGQGWVNIWLCAHHFDRFMKVAAIHGVKVSDRNVEV